MIVWLCFPRFSVRSCCNLSVSNVSDAEQTLREAKTCHYAFSVLFCLLAIWSHHACHVAIVLHGTSCFHIFPMSVFIFAVTILDSPTSDLPYGGLICLYTHQSPVQSYPKGRCRNIQLLLPFSLRVLKNIRDRVWCSCQVLSSTLHVNFC